MALSAATVALFLSCAHQVSPSGGPDDKTGPTIMISEPVAGAVMVDPKNGIAITFSEWISRTAAPKAVSILPPVDGGVKVRVAGRRLEITPAKAFALSTTYHVVLTSALQDLHGNPLSSSHTLVFSTGATLDSGCIAGCVVDPGRESPQTIVALYRDNDSLGDTALFGNPDYLTQTDSASFFSFENVRVGTYRVVAFTDQNNNRRLNPGAEAAYAPLHRTIALTSKPDTILLFPMESDTVRLKLLSAAPLGPTMLQCALSAPIDSSRGLSDPTWKIEPFEKKGGAIKITSTEWIGAIEQRCILHLADTMALVPYRTKNNPLSDTMRFNGARPHDTVSPALSSVSPTVTVIQEPELRLLFNEPVTITLPLMLTDSLLDTVALIASNGYSDTIILTPQRRLHAGSIYRLLILKSFGKDLAGNLLKPRDSTDTVLVPQFKVFETDSLAVSLNGCVSCLAPDSLRTWQFIPFIGANRPLSRDSSGCFSFDSIPAGKGFVAYFRDLNRNKKPDRGVLVPWRAPEPYFVLPDTIEARARWEIEDVELQSACKGCGKHEPVKSDTTAKKAKKP
jgi:hypothetical protein